VLRRCTEEVRRLSDQVIARRDVRHGRLVLMPLDFQSKVAGRKRIARRRHRCLHVHQGALRIFRS